MSITLDTSLLKEAYSQPDTHCEGLRYASVSQDLRRVSERACSTVCYKAQPIRDRANRGQQAAHFRNSSRGLTSISQGKLRIGINSSAVVSNGLVPTKSSGRAHHGSVHLRPS